MKKYEDIKTAICPKCGQEYTGRPALSRADNKTMICPDCGIHEALENPKAAKYILFIKDRCLYPIFTLHVHVLISEFRYLRSNRYT